MKHLLLISVLMSLSWSCRSAEKTETSTPHSKSVSQTPATDPTEPDPVANPLCASRPEPVACCEALTPACNQCRQDSQAEQAAWEEACLPQADAKANCKKPPAVSECCSEYTEACESCRQQAAATLLAWKAECGTYEAHSCDEQPPTSMCCQAMIPSCLQCKDRNRRIREEWEDRCVRESPTEE